jgi:thioredoxin-dependent peroxiredoxin
MLKIAEAAPSFSLEDQNGKMHKLEDYRGQYVHIYFYPKDMTPGCTIESKTFRDRMGELTELGVVVFGVSCDSVVSHKKFCDKAGLNFSLLADTEKKMVADYGVWVEKSMFGKKYMGIQRDSFLIGKEGELLKHYVKVKPAKHPKEVVADIKAL